MTEICGIGNPDAPGAYSCEYPLGHDRIWRYGAWQDHGAPSARVCWVVPPSTAAHRTAARGSADWAHRRGLATLAHADDRGSRCPSTTWRSCRARDRWRGYGCDPAARHPLHAG